MLMPQKYQAFLSYSRKDAGVDAELINHFSSTLQELMNVRLSKCSFEVFKDVDKIRLGEYWSERLEKAIRESHFLIVLLSPSWIRSEWCRKEFKNFFDLEARRGGQYIIPILVREMEGEVPELEGEKLKIYLELRKRQHREVLAPEFRKLNEDGRILLVEAVASHIYEMIRESRNKAQFMFNSTLIVENPVERRSALLRATEVPNNDLQAEARINVFLFEKIVETMKAQFKSSKLKAYTEQCEAIDLAVRRLTGVGIARKAVLPSTISAGLITDDAWKGNFETMISEISFNNERISVQCIGLLPSAVSTILYMKNRLFFNIDIRYDCNIGRDIANSLGEMDADPYDFLISGKSGTYFSCSDEVIKYRQVLSVTSIHQSLYVWRGDDSLAANHSVSRDKIKRILYLPETSAEEQIFSGAISLTNVKQEPKEIDFLKIKFDQEAAFIRWQPINQDLPIQRIDGGDYEFELSMFAHKVWTGGYRNVYLKQFLNVFVAAWNYLANNPDMATDMLKYEFEYHIAFAEGAGIRI